MKRFFAYLLIVVSAIFLLQGCAGRGHVIPKDKMARIYAEMFIADQWLKDHPDSRKMSDTTFFYDPIFRKYGYNIRDYDASVRHYAKFPEKYAKIMGESASILESEIARLKGIKSRQELARRLNDFASGYQYHDFSDSTMWEMTIADSILNIKEDAERRDSVRTDSLKTSGQFLRYKLITGKGEIM